MPNWEDFIQPAPLKLECAACGRSAYLDNLKLCDQCRDEYEQETREIDAREREFEDAVSTRAFYNG